MPELTIDLSWQSIHLLTELERWGVYGVTKEEIAARFVDRVLCDMAERRHLKLVKPETTEAHSIERISQNRDPVCARRKDL